MSVMWVVALIMLALVSSAASPDDKHVVVLDSSNFSSVVGVSSVLVEFYAPWCGHCKALAPEYAKAAKTLADEGKPGMLAKVDCDAEANRDLCAQWQVRGFPTIKFFDKEASDRPEDYKEQRSAKALVEYVKRRSGPPTSDVTAASFDAWAKGKKTYTLAVFCGCSNCPDKKELFQKLAIELRSGHDFAITDDSSLGEKFGISCPGLATFLGSSPTKPSIFTGEWNSANVKNHILSESFELLDEISPENYQQYLDRGLPFFWVFVDAKELKKGVKDGKSLSLVAEVLSEFKGVVSGVYLDGEKYEKHRNQLGHSASLPGILIEDSSAKQKFLFSGDFNSASIKQFLSDFKAGALKPFLKSEPIPEKQDSPVRHIVGHTWEEEVKANSKNVFVEYYAPWCGHCKKLAPIWEELAQKYSGNENIVIGKVDVTANDTPEDIQGFPTLIFYPAGSKDSPVPYQGERTIDAFESFLAEKGIEVGTHSKDEL